MGYGPLCSQLSVSSLQNVPDLAIVASTLSAGSNGRPQYAPGGSATTPTTHGELSWAGYV